MRNLCYVYRAGQCRIYDDEGVKGLQLKALSLSLNRLRCHFIATNLEDRSVSEKRHKI